MTVTEAKFRLAKPYEVQKAKGDCLVQALSTPWKIFNKIWGTANLYFGGANVLSWGPPLPLRAAHWVTWRLGLAPQHAFLNESTSFLFDIFQITDEKVATAFFDHHRNGKDKLFTPNRSFMRLFDMIMKTFPETVFNEEDVMFTCGEDKSKFFRRMFTGAMHGEAMKTAIHEEVKETVERWIKECCGGKFINITAETRRLASNIITRVLLGQKVDNTNLCDAVNYINEFTVKELLRTATKEDRDKYEKALKIFRQQTNNILNSNNEIPLLRDEKLTEPQKQALVFVTFFAGQETVASLINNALYEIGKDPIQAQRFENDDVNDIYVRHIRGFTPAAGVGRKVNIEKNVCLKYKLEGEETWRKVIFFAGQGISARIISLADATVLPDEGPLADDLPWKPFGDGPHTCPGRFLAEREFKELFTELKNGYKITLDPNMGEATKVGRVTLQLDKDVFINIKKKDE